MARQRRRRQCLEDSRRQSGCDKRRAARNPRLYLRAHYRACRRESRELHAGPLSLSSELVANCRGRLDLLAASVAGPGWYKRRIAARVPCCNATRHPRVVLEARSWASGRSRRAGSVLLQALERVLGEEAGVNPPASRCSRSGRCRRSTGSIARTRVYSPLPHSVEPPVDPEPRQILHWYFVN